MALSGSLIQKELMLQPRRKYFYAKRCAVTGAGGIILLLCLLVGTMSQSTTIGMQLVRWLGYGLLFILAVIAPVTGGQSIFAEKEHKTLGLLYLTDMHNMQIVVGKFFSSFITVFMVLFSVLPMFILSVTLGGIAASQIAAALAVIVGTMFLGTCLGLFIGTEAKSEKNLFRTIITAIVFLYLIVPGVVWLTESFYPGLPPWLPECLNPFVAMNTILLGDEIGHALTHLPYTFSVGSIFLFMVFLKLPRQVQDNPKRTWRQRLGILPTAPSEEDRKHIPPIAKSNPVTWKDQHFVYGGNRKVILLLLGLTAIGAGLAYVFVRYKSLPVDEALTYLFGFSTFGSIGLFVMLSMIRACRAFNAEKASGAMQVLLTTSMSAKEIVMGKYWAIWRIGMPWIILGIISFIPFILAVESAGFDADFLILLSLGAWTCVLVSVPVAFWLSLHYNTSVTFCLSTFIFLAWLYIRSMFMIPVFAFGMILAKALSGGDSLIVMCIVAAIPLAIIDGLMSMAILHLLISIFRITASRKL